MRVNNTFWGVTIAVCSAIVVVHVVFQAMLGFHHSGVNSNLEIWNYLGFRPIKEFLDAYQTILFDILILIMATLTFAYHRVLMKVSIEKPLNGWMEKWLKSITENEFLRFHIAGFLLLSVSAFNPNLFTLVYALGFVMMVLFKGFYVDDSQLQTPLFSILWNRSSIFLRLLFAFAVFHLTFVNISRFTFIHSHFIDTTCQVLGIECLELPFWEEGNISASIGICLEFLLLLFLSFMKPYFLAPFKRTFISGNTGLDDRLVISLNGETYDLEELEEKEDPAFELDEFDINTSGIVQFIEDKVERTRNFTQRLISISFLNHGRLICSLALMFYNLVLPSGFALIAVAVLVIGFSSQEKIFIRMSPLLLTYFASVFILQFISTIPELFEHTPIMTRLGMVYHPSPAIYVLINSIPALIMMYYCNELKPLERSSRSLLYSVSKNYNEGVRQALRKDPDCVLNERNEKGQTALHVAASDGFDNFIDILNEFSSLRLQMIMEVRDHNDESAADVALRKRHFQFYTKLRALGAFSPSDDPILKRVSFARIWSEFFLLGSSLIYEHGFKLNLLFLYFVGLKSIDLLHAGYLLLFLVFFGLPSLTRRAWYILTGYAGLVVVLMYAFQVFEIKPDAFISRIIGISSDNSNLVLPVLILVIAVSQLNLLRKAENNAYIQEALKSVDFFNLRLVFHSFSTFLVVVFDLLGIWITYASIVVYCFSREANVIGFVYLVLVVVALLIHIFSTYPNHNLRRFWFIIVFYCALVLFLMYAYQFVWIREQLDELQNRSRLPFTARDFGLISAEKNLFIFMIPCTVNFILSVIQYRLFVMNQGNISHDSLEELDNRINALFGQNIIHRLSAIINALKTFIQELSGLLLVLCCLLVIYSEASISHMVFLLILVIFASVRRIYPLAWVPISIYSSLLLCFHYLFCLEPVSRSKYSYLFRFLGLSTFKDSGMWEIRSLFGTLMILLCCLFRRIMRKSGSQFLLEKVTKVSSTLPPSINRPKNSISLQSSTDFLSVDEEEKESKNELKPRVKFCTRVSCYFSRCLSFGYRFLYHSFVLFKQESIELLSKHSLDVGMWFLMLSLWSQKNVASLVFLSFEILYVFRKNRTLQRLVPLLMVLLAFSLFFQYLTSLQSFSENSDHAFTLGTNLTPDFRRWLLLSDSYVVACYFEFFSLYFLSFSHLDLKCSKEVRKYRNHEDVPMDEFHQFEHQAIHSDFLVFQKFWRTVIYYLLHYFDRLILLLILVSSSSHVNLIDLVFLLFFCYLWYNTPQNPRKSFRFLLLYSFSAISFLVVYSSPHIALPSLRGGIIERIVGWKQYSSVGKGTSYQLVIIFILLDIHRTVLGSLFYIQVVEKSRLHERLTAALRGEARVDSFAKVLLSKGLDIKKRKKMMLEKLEKIFFQDKYAGLSSFQETTEEWDSEVWACPVNDENLVLDLKKSSQLHYDNADSMPDPPGLLTMKLENATLLPRIDEEFEEAEPLEPPPTQTSSFAIYWYRYFKFWIAKHVDESMISNLDTRSKMKKRNSSTFDIPMFTLLTRFIGCHTHGLLIFAFIAAFFYNPSFLSLFVPLIIFVYGIIENPRASQGFWMFVLAFTQLKICALFIFQMPIFCDDNMGSFPPKIWINTNLTCPEFHFSGSSSHLFYEPFGLEKIELTNNDLSFFKAVLFDIFCIFFLSVHRSAMKSRGLWELNELEVLKTEGKEWEHLPDFENNQVKHFSITHRCLRYAPYFIRNYFYGIFPYRHNGSKNYALKPGKELYSFVFLLQLCALLFGAIFWSPMTFSGDSVAKALASTNQFSAEFVLFLCVETLILVMDRVVYLYRSSWAKLGLQYFTVTLVHLFVFVLCPQESSKNFAENSYLNFFYAIQVAYFLVSGVQIRYGFTEFNETHHFLTKRASPVRSFLFMIYRAMPFLYELRILLDWMCTHTALDLIETLKLEDIHAQLFTVKCRLFWKSMKERGAGQPWYMKFLSGTLLFLALLGLLLLPLIWFSSANPAAIANAVEQVSISITVVLSRGQYHLCDISTLLSKSQVSTLYYQELKANRYVSDQDISSVQHIYMSPFSDTSWDISPPNLASFRRLLNSSDSNQPKLNFRIAFTRKGPPNNRMVYFEREINVLRQQILDVLSQDGDAISTVDFSTAPLYYRLTGLGEVLDPSENRVGVSDRTRSSSKLQYGLSLRRENSTLYWILSRANDKEPEPQGFELVTISDSFFESSLLGNAIAAASAGIVTFYVAVVLTVGRFLRMFVSDQVQRIITTDLQNVDELLELSEAIFLARTVGDLAREETMYRNLIRIHRSPEMLIKLTRRRPKED